MIEFDILEKISSENKELRNRIKCFESVIEYYAENKNWRGKENIARDDRGDLARRTLEKWKKLS